LTPKSADETISWNALELMEQVRQKGLAAIMPQDSPKLDPGAQSTEDWHKEGQKQERQH